MIRLIPHEAGTSLIAVMIAAAITGILAVTISTMIVNSQKAVSSTRIGNDLNSLQVILGKQISCAKTMNGVNPTSCAGFIPLKRADGVTIVDGSAAGTQFGEWTVRATCSSTGLNIRAARVNRNSDTGFNTDPLTGRVQSWTASLSNIFPTGAPCQSYFSASAPPFVFTTAPHSSWHRTWGDANNTIPLTCNPGGSAEAQLIAGAVGCPTGYKIIAGNLFCGVGMSQGTIVDPDGNFVWGSCCPSVGQEAVALMRADLTSVCGLIPNN